MSRRFEQGISVKFLIYETLKTLNTDDVFEFGLGEISKPVDDEAFYQAELVFVRNGKSTKRTVSHMSEFAVLTSFLTHVGIKLRSIAKDDSIEFELHGLTFDQYIPLTKKIRDTFDE